MGLEWAGRGVCYQYEFRTALGTETGLAATATATGCAAAARCATTSTATATVAESSAAATSCAEATAATATTVTESTWRCQLEMSFRHVLKRPWLGLGGVRMVKADGLFQVVCGGPDVAVLEKRFESSRISLLVHICACL